MRKKQLIVIMGLAKTIKCTVQKSILISVYFFGPDDFERALETSLCPYYILKTVLSQGGFTPKGRDPESNQCKDDTFKAATIIFNVDQSVDYFLD